MINCANLEWQASPPKNLTTNLLAWLNFPSSTTQQLANYATQVQTDQHKLEDGLLTRTAWLFCQDKCWMYAMTCIPEDLIPKNMQGKMATTPIGQWIFRHPEVKREIIAFAPLEKSHPDYLHITQHHPAPTPQVWVRYAHIWLPPANADTQTESNLLPHHQDNHVATAPHLIRLWEVFIQPPINHAPNTTNPYT